MSDARTSNRFANLRQAFAAPEKPEVRSPHGDRGPCLSLIRLRDLAENASLTTSTDSRHLNDCRKCFVRLSAMQSELGTDPRSTFEVKVKEYEHKLSRFAVGEQPAGELFHRIHVHRGDPDWTFTWSHTDLPVQALRDHHCPGDKQDAESIVVMSSTAIGSALADASTPFACDLDAAWPLLFMMVNTAYAVHDDDDLAVLFTCSYSQIVVNAPVPIKAMFVYGIGTMLRLRPLEGIASGVALQLARKGDATVQSIVTMLGETEAPALKLAARTSARASVDPQIARINAWLSEHNDRLRVQGDLSGIVSTIQLNIAQLLANIYKDGDTTSQLLQLLLARHYVSHAVAKINDHWPNTLDRVHYLGDLATMVMKSAQRAGRQYFAATEVVSAIGAYPSAIRAMAELLEAPDSSMRRALFVYHLQLARRACAPAAVEAVHLFDDHACELATHDPEIASLMKWSRVHRGAPRVMPMKQSARV